MVGIDHLMYRQGEGGWMYFVVACCLGVAGGISQGGGEQVRPAHVVRVTGSASPRLAFTFGLADVVDLEPHIRPCGAPHGGHDATTTINRTAGTTERRTRCIDLGGSDTADRRWLR